MSKKEIFSIAKFAYNEAKARDFRDQMKPLEPWMTTFILNFYSLAQGIEREQCAKECEDYGREEEMQAIGDNFAKAIRARGQT